jgi:hypothetical protein
VPLDPAREVGVGALEHGPHPVRAIAVDRVEQGPAAGGLVGLGEHLVRVRLPGSSQGLEHGEGLDHPGEAREEMGLEQGLTPAAPGTYSGVRAQGSELVPAAQDGRDGQAHELGLHPGNGGRRAVALGTTEPGFRIDRLHVLEVSGPRCRNDLETADPSIDPLDRLPLPGRPSRPGLARAGASG